MLANGEIRYIYRVALGKDSFEVDKIDELNNNQREVKSRRGILMEVIPTGRIAEHSSMTLLVNLTASLTLLATATLITNALAVYILKHKKYYSAAIYQKTCDFSDVHALEEMEEENLEQILIARGLPPHGDRTQRILKLLKDGWTSNLLELHPQLSNGRRITDTELQPHPFDRQRSSWMTIP
eukprot:gnl/MRDRNA2_/MRDRNA2_346561_c0_seq1.p1 gnl/MRDRNA2_/MRDRNA2_346561_c0~~gnl/MRDRNA2_/MRDRNA2_346561_c0_seq1.p1  ORF type:complete len:191 (-),score=31.77 gnl/MRDRNA2_/MRDRNA2_346561_c0_seq1:312-857(-)